MYAPLSRNVFWIYGALQIKIIISINALHFAMCDPSRCRRRRRLAPAVAVNDR